MSCCLSHLILLTFILGSSWANILSILSTFAPHFKYIVLLCHQLHLGVLSKHIADPSASHIYEYIQFCHSFYSQDNDVAQRRWQHCCSLVVICLEVSHSWRRVMSDSIACQLCHIFFLWLYILWLCFHHFLLIMLLRAFCTDSSGLLLILAMNLSFVISNDYLEGGTTVPLQLCIKKNCLINQKWIVYFKMTPNCILCLFGKVSKLCMCFSVN